MKILSCLLYTLLSVIVRQPQVPVLVERGDNILAEIELVSDSAAEAEGVITLEFSGLPVKNIRKVDLRYAGTSSVLMSRTRNSHWKESLKTFGGSVPERFRETMLEYSVKPKSGTVKLPFKRQLVKGSNLFFVNALVSGKGLDMSSMFSCKVVSVELDGESLALEYSGNGDVRRFAQALKDRGDDGSNVFRIPALARTNAGTLIAAYDVRWTSFLDLQGDIDVGVSRSTDGGRSWQKMRIAMDMGEFGGLPEAQNGCGDPCILVDRTTGDIFIFAIWAHGLQGGYSTIVSGPGLDPIDATQCIMVRSSDDGKTWSAPVNITSQVKDPSWRNAFQGPGAGICMADGTLVVPFQYWREDGITCSTIIYSKDHGITWTCANPAADYVCEDQVAEVEPGVLMLNMRNLKTSRKIRRVAITKDLGITWEEVDSDIIEPQCQASLIASKASENVFGKDILLFCNPASQTSRKDMTVRLSFDGGCSWPHNLNLDSEPGWGYSSMALIDSETLGIVYEGSAAQLVFQTIKLQDLCR